MARYKKELTKEQLGEALATPGMTVLAQVGIRGCSPVSFVKITKKEVRFMSRTYFGEHYGKHFFAERFTNEEGEFDDKTLFIKPRKFGHLSTP